MEQTLDEFISDMKNELEFFEENWRIKNKISPEDYPLEMEDNDWFEHFTIQL